MTNKITDLINKNLHSDYATATGRNVHAKMQSVFYTPNGWTGDENIINKLSNIPELKEFMGPLSRTEVPIAGTINGKFISRRIDRLYVNNDIKKVVVLDYKTDTDKKVFFEKYRVQLKEYYELLKQIYNGFNIECKILWLNDFTLENII
ncbi:MAG: hypothetical protein IJQ90_02515 [Alphaproteobacteria bacterium]|nr:hypothetical protein [Alphaproteobacteria bacterium]